jgi:hypothetical protein
MVMEIMINIPLGMQQLQTSNAEVCNNIPFSVALMRRSIATPTTFNVVEVVIIPLGMLPYVSLIIRGLT